MVGGHFVTNTTSKDKPAVIYRTTVRESLVSLEGGNPCPSCNGKGHHRKMSGKAPCFDCDSTGDANHPPYDDFEDEREFEEFINRLVNKL
jgi:hypothetical protein